MPTRRLNSKRQPDYSPERLLALQAKIGNRGVGAMISTGPGNKPKTRTPVTLVIVFLAAALAALVLAVGWTQLPRPLG